MGVQIPAGHHERLNKLKEELQASPDKFPRLQSYMPPHGGHTKNSFIRQEMQNLTTLNQQFEESIAPAASELLGPGESVSLQAQQNRENRVARDEPMVMYTARVKLVNRLNNNTSLTAGDAKLGAGLANRTARG